MARIELRHCNITIKDGLAGTAAVNQMADAVDVLLEQVREQIQSPQVEQIVGAPQGQRPTRVARTRQFTGAIRTQTPEEIAKALARQSLPGLECGAAAPDGTS